MKRKHFYAHLVETTKITLEIGELDLDNKERVHLLSLVEANIHSKVMLNILSNLTEDDKKIFLKNLALESSEVTWKHLDQKIANAQDKLKQIIDASVKELLKDIQEVKKLKAK